MADNTQSQSLLFRAPFDVRRIILSYSLPSAVHVHTKHGKVVVSACVSPDAVHDQSDGQDRKADLPLRGRDWNCEDEYLHAQRLMSTWGPHWRCEEVTRKQQRDLGYSALLAMLRVCKLMRDEVADLMVRDAVFNITDIHTSLQLLIGSPSMMVLNCSFENIRKLEVTLRFPADGFKAMEHGGDENNQSFVALQKYFHVGGTEAALWLDVCCILAQLPKLTKMRLWLDHDRRGYWAKVNERAFIAPLIASFEHKDVEIMLHLPFVNPRLEDTERHFQEDKVASRVYIDRRRRQRKFGYVTVLGRLQVYDYLDFPCLDQSTPGFEDMDADQRLAMERVMWKDGENMQFWKDGLVHVNRGRSSPSEHKHREEKIVEREQELGCSLKWPAVL